MSRFDPRFEDLSATLPIFPLTGVLLLPRGSLPLNIFEVRYLNMVEDALAADRMIGMIQPSDPESDDSMPTVYKTGCAGRIVHFEETDDDRYLITLQGVSRFRWMEELPTTRGYRRVTADWSPFASDLRVEEGEDLDLEALLTPLRTYFDHEGINANWDAINETPAERLITSLAMICPFEPPEKQALLEARDLADRTKVLTALVEMAVLSSSSGDSARQ